MNRFIGGLLFLLLVTGIGYLLCSLFSLSFNINEWNTFSNIMKWIVLVIDAGILEDIFFGDRM